MRRPRFSLAPILILVLATVAASQEPAPLEYAVDVRPLLAEHCFPCHGPDQRSRRPRSEPLRLDQRADAVAVREDGEPVLVPGQPDASHLFQRLVTDDRSERMPPGSRGPLDESDIATLRRWIEEGAAYQEHWSFVPPVRPAPPAVTDERRVQTPVDRFVQARLGAGLTPAPAADRRTLLRRLSFDLRGLPPTPQEVDAFVADPRADAYERRVEEYLDSDAHAERMTTWWLDLVRFADTIGIHGDNPWHIYPYRDWVLGAFRDNMPFDRFTREQLAGDLLETPTQDQKVAAAYNRLNLITREGGSQPKEFLIRYAADRVRNLSEVWLGMTVGCAECHDHKYDPITSREFYELSAFFADIEQVGVYQDSEEAFEPEMRVPSAMQATRLAELDRWIAVEEERYQAGSPELEQDRERWLAEQGEQEAAWSLLRPVQATSDGGATLTVLDDGSIHASGTSPATDTYRLSFTLERPVTALRVELMQDDAFPQRGPGRADNGNLVVSEVEWSVDGIAQAVASVATTRDQDGYPIAHAIDGKGGRPGWALLRDGRTSSSFGLFQFAPGDPLTGTATLVLQQEHGTRHTIGRLRVWGAASPGPSLPSVTPEVATVLRRERPASEAEQRTLRSLHREVTPLLAETRERLAALRVEHEELEDAIPRVLATVAVEPMETRVRPRGNWMDDSGDVVEPGVPSVLGGLAIDERATRRELADWLLREDHPLTARVVVNRLWKLYLGRGLVISLDDFGRQGAAPTHLALLDYLAREFVDHGFDLRFVIRQIVLSSTYRQSSVVSPELREADPYNERLARQARFRVDAEFVRDTALTVSGLLRPRFGGPSVRPYQPAGYYAHLNFPVRKYQPSEGDDLYRRSVYTHWQRQYVHPSMRVFDAPSRERCTAERPVSNTPLAALALLNDPIFVEAARALATRVLVEVPGDDDLRVAQAFRWVLQRPPLRHELEMCRELVTRHRQQYRADPEAAQALIEVGEQAAPPDRDAVELAAWTSLARVLLNLHETITRS